MTVMSNVMQENLLLLLCYDNESAPLVISNIEVSFYENEYYRRIAELAIKFYNTYDTVIADHLADELAPELNDPKTADIYTNILASLEESKETVNKQYVLDNLNKFVRLQNGKLLLKKGVDLLQKGKIDEWEAEVSKTKSARIELFDPGVRFGVDMARTLDVSDFDDDMIMTGIKALDKLGHVPTKKELYIVMGRPGGKKSWACVYLAKMALLQRKKVAHITLELSEDRLKQRYFQAFFGIGSREEEIQQRNPIFDIAANGRIASLNFRDLPTVPLMTDPQIMEHIALKITKLRQPQLVIKEFSTGSLTVDMLRAYLDNLEHYYGFIPDMVVLDYLDLMDIDTAKLRIDLGRTAIELRGLAVDRNLAMVTAAQSNRLGEGTRVLTRKHLGEDFSKVKTTDVLITLNASKMEREHGLMRLYVDKGRNGRDGDTIVVSQNISIGQFCLKSGLVSKEYMQEVITKYDEEDKDE
jgi:hypothetical protein